MATYGTYAVDNLLAVTAQSVIDFGEDKTWEGVQQMLLAHNRLLDEKYSLLVDRTQDALRRYGGADRFTLADLDEYGTGDAQTIAAGSNVGFPLRKKGRPLQWTYTYLEEISPNDIIGQTQGLMDADISAIDAAIVRAIFTPTNTSFVDRLKSNVTLPVKAFLNADGAPIPPDPYGNTFNSATHNHYLGTSSLVASDVDGLINTVSEHFASGRTMLFINKAQATALAGFTGFTAYPAYDVVVGANTNTARGVLDPVMGLNRAIGVFGSASAQVWVKPWVPAAYMFAFQSGVEKPLVFRYRNDRTAQFRVVYEDELHPLRARSMEREFGIGVWNRHTGAVLDCTNSTYTMSTTLP